jgi:dipeptidyl aminopeptidase/acylaminoacyl peptidase
MKPKRYLAFCVILALILPVLVLSVEKRPMTVDDLFRLKRVYDASISADGSLVAFVVSSVDLEKNRSTSNIYLTKSRGGSLIRLTTSEKRDHSPRFSPDGKLIAFLSNRDEKTQVWLINPRGGEADKLTDEEAGVRSFVWSPDGKKIACIAHEPETRKEKERKKKKEDVQVVDKDIKMGRLLVIDLDTKKEKMLTEGDYTVSSPTFSPDGKLIAFVKRPTPKADDRDKSDIMVVPVAGGEVKPLVVRPGSDSSPEWSPDGKTIAFLSSDGKENEIAVSRICIVSAGGGEPKNISKSVDRSPRWLSWSPDSSKLYFTAIDGVVSNLYSIEVATERVTKLTAEEGVIGSLSFTRDGKMMAFTREDPYHPADIHISEVGFYRPKKLTDMNPWVKELDFGELRTIRWKSKDGMEIEGLIILPVGYTPGKRYPLITQVHGGPAGVMMRSFNCSYSRNGQILAGLGYAVFQPNFRGSSGYGEAFLRADVRDWGKGDYDDIMTGVDYLIERGIVDRLRLGLAGWSYGGYMTSWVVTQTDRFTAAAYGAGLTDLYSMYTLNDIPGTLDAYFGGPPWDEFDIYWSSSAMKYVNRAKTPTLIFQGKGDARVPPAQSWEFYQALKRLEIPTGLIIYPREGHGLREPNHQRDKVVREINWFNKYILGKEEKKENKAGVKQDK